MKLTFNRIPLLNLAIMLIAVLIGIFGIGRFGSNVVDASASGPTPSNTSEHFGKFPRVEILRRKVVV